MRLTNAAVALTVAGGATSLSIGHGAADDRHARLEPRVIKDMFSRLRPSKADKAYESPGDNGKKYVYVGYTMQPKSIAEAWDKTGIPTISSRGSDEGAEQLGQERADPEAAQSSISEGENVGGERTKQLGDGVYFTPSIDGLKLVPDSKDGTKDEQWYCLIRCEKEGWDDAPKVRVPEVNENQDRLWFNEENIADYIIKLRSRKWYKGTMLKKKWDPALTVRLATVNDADEDSRLGVLPPDLLGNKGGLDFKVECAALSQRLPTSMPLKYWNRWDNLRGEWRIKNSVSHKAGANVISADQEQAKKDKAEEEARIEQEVSQRVEEKDEGAGEPEIRGHSSADSGDAAEEDRQEEPKLRSDNTRGGEGEEEQRPSRSSSRSSATETDRGNTDDSLVVHEEVYSDADDRFEEEPSEDQEPHSRQRTHRSSRTREDLPV